MYSYENDKFHIPKRIKQMTKEEIEEEKEKLLKEILQQRKNTVTITNKQEILEQYGIHI